MCHSSDLLAIMHQGTEHVSQQWAAGHHASIGTAHVSQQYSLLAIMHQGTEHVSQQ